MEQKSPFDKFFTPSIKQVPEVFRKQFLLTPENGNKIIFEGIMEEVWHKPKIFKPLFWLMGKLGFFIPYTGENIAARVEIIAEVDKNKQVVHKFKRNFFFPKPTSFNSIMFYDHEKEELAEMLGPFNILYFTWEAAYIAPNTFKFRSSKMAIQILGYKIWLPKFIWICFGFVEFNQFANEDGSTTIDMSVKLPILGDFFGYRGRFRI